MVIGGQLISHFYSSSFKPSVTFMIYFFFYPAYTARKTFTLLKGNNILFYKKIELKNRAGFKSNFTNIITYSYLCKLRWLKMNRAYKTNCLRLRQRILSGLPPNFAVHQKISNYL